MFDKKIIIYTATAMSGLVKEDVVANARQVKSYLERAGFKVLCPVAEEKIEPTKEIIQTSYEDMLGFWRRDKQMIRESHILFHMSPHINSVGAWQEVGYKRYHLQGPVVHIYPLGKLPHAGAVTRLENDYVCDSLEEAIEYTLRTHGTFSKRTIWRVKKLLRCLPKSFYYQLLEWFK